MARRERRPASPGGAARDAARTAEGGTILTGPVSALALHDAEATIQFVVRVTPYGYGEEAF